MGNAEGARRAREHRLKYGLEQYGSIEAYREAERKRLSAMGKAPHKTRTYMDIKIASKAGKKSGEVRKAKKQSWIKTDITKILVQDGE
jgi:hypothetical protein